MVAFLVANKTAVLVFLLATSELMACIPKFKSNSILQAIINGLGKIK
jgi:hypothetical protein